MTTSTLRGAGHVWEGGDDSTGINLRGDQKFNKDGNRRQPKKYSWHALKYFDTRPTEDMLDYVRWGLRMSADEIEHEIRYGNLPDGLYLADDKTGAVYRVTGGRLIQTQFRTEAR